jgi:uncharacterized protein (TIGR03437 family)
VSAASLRAGALAPESIATAFGSALSKATEAASGDPPPTLGGTSVTIRDSAGIERPAPLFYVSPGQINYLVPTGTAIGPASVTITPGGSDPPISQQITIANVAPGIFTLNRAGLAAAAVTRVSGDSQTFEDVYQLDASSAVVTRVIDLRPATDDVYLTIFGTGFRRAGSATVTMGGVSAEVLYAGSQGAFLGLDQINVRVPKTLAGRGEIEIAVTAAGQVANAVRLTFR